MDEFAVWIMAGVQMRTVAVGFVGVLSDDGAEMFLVTVRVTLSFLTLVSCAIVAVLHVLLLLELF